MFVGIAISINGYVIPLGYSNLLQNKNVCLHWYKSISNVPLMWDAVAHVEWSQSIPRIFCYVFSLQLSMAASFVKLATAPNGFKVSER